MSDQGNSEQKASNVYRLVPLGGGEDFARVSKDGDDLNAGSSGSNVASEAYEKEDEYHHYYIGRSNDRGVLEPPYCLRQLDRLCQENNTLLPCIEAMVTNIAKTGYDFTTDDDKVESAEDDKRITELKEFFAEPWPGESWTTIQEKVERDVQRLGNGYLEVLRNPKGEIIFARHVDAKMMRLVKLGKAVPVVKSIKRKGVEQSVKTMQRERVFCQLLNGKTMVFFKEFNASRDVNKKTGEFAKPGESLPAADRGTEIIHITALPDSHTPYGVPHWINQIPSILGSRKAEEFNMEFFDHGGVPPALVILQGGSMQDTTRQALENKVALGSAKSKNRIQVLEVEPTGGSIDHPNNAKVTVERFGGERTSDAMFEGYDDKCEKRVRRSFRIPPIFLGQVEDFNFATAFAAFTVTEAQVFKPVRDRRDETVNNLVKALGYTDVKFESKPLVIEDAALKLQGIELALSTNVVDGKDAVYEINEACGTALKFSETAGLATHTVNVNGQIVPITQQGVTAADQRSVNDNTPGKAPAAAVAKGELRGVVALAEETLRAFRDRDLQSLAKNISLAATLDDRGRAELRKATALMQFADPDNDPDGLAELMGCTLSVMAQGGASCAHH